MGQIKTVGARFECVNEYDYVIYYRDDANGHAQSIGREAFPFDTTLLTKGDRIVLSFDKRRANLLVEVRRE